MFTESHVKEALKALNQCAMAEEEFDRSLHMIIDDVVAVFVEAGVKELRFKGIFVSVNATEGARVNECKGFILSVACVPSFPFVTCPDDAIEKANKGIRTSNNNVFETTSMDAKKWLLDNCVSLCNEVTRRGRLTRTLTEPLVNLIKKVFGDDVKTIEDMARSMIKSWSRLGGEE